MPELIVTPRAEGDIVAAFERYETCCSGLGTRFVIGVDAVLSSIARNPLAYVVRHRGHRMAMLDHYPYAVYFLCAPGGDVVSVRRVLHFHQDIPNRL